MAEVLEPSTVLHVALTLLAFLLGLAVGWLWWGRQFVRARLTRGEALSIMQAQVERELADTDARIAQLMEPYEGLGLPSSAPGTPGADETAGPRTGQGG